MAQNKKFKPWVKQDKMNERDKQMERQGWEKARRQIKENLGLVKPNEK